MLENLSKKQIQKLKSFHQEKKHLPKPIKYDDLQVREIDGLNNRNSKASDNSAQMGAN
ncbi:MAG: hypothetical protein K0R73_934 [Candidatus Midichloriaceae bacterium]|nr:hypothetical protein [Candidatus Midichloriaceae bacterium]